MAVADVRPHPAGRTPRRLRRWIEIAVIPPEQPGCGVQAVAVHAGFCGFGDRTGFYPLRFLEVSEVNVIVSVAPISLTPRDSVERWIIVTIRKVLRPRKLRGFLCPGGTSENSPTFQRWEANPALHESRREG